MKAIYIYVRGGDGNKRNAPLVHINSSPNRLIDSNYGNGYSDKLNRYLSIAIIYSDVSLRGTVKEGVASL